MIQINTTWSDVPSLLVTRNGNNLLGKSVINIGTWTSFSGRARGVRLNSHRASTDFAGLVCCRVVFTPSHLEDQQRLDDVPLMSLNLLWTFEEFWIHLFLYVYPLRHALVQ
jgi:hypothetical protein